MMLPPLYLTDVMIFSCWFAAPSYPMHTAVTFILKKIFSVAQVKLKIRYASIHYKKEVYSNILLVYCF